MTNSSSVSGAGNVVASRYASSLIDVAAQAGVLEAVQSDLNSLEKTMQNSQDFSAFVENPVHGADRQMAAIREIAQRGKFHQVTANFLCVLAENRRLNILSAIFAAFHREIAKRNNEIEAFVKTAHALSAAQEQKLAQELANRTGKNVRLFIEVDQSLLGGMVVTIGSRMIDTSVQTQLSRLKNAMISNSNQNASLKEVG